MITTGIVRRIDDLGRIVIPGELRRILFGRRDATGRPIEFFYEGDAIIMKPYKMITEAYVYVGSNNKIKLAADLSEGDKNIVYIGEFESLEDAEDYHEYCTQN